MADKPWRDATTLKRLYHQEGLSMSEVAERLGCSYRTVYNWMEKHDIPRRKPFKDRVPSLRTDYHGYECWIVSTESGRKAVKHHRLLATVENGPDSVKDKDVHHKINIPWLNFRENVEPVDRNSHMQHHLEDGTITRDSDGKFQSKVIE